MKVNYKVFKNIFLKKLYSLLSFLNLVYLFVFLYGKLTWILLTMFLVALCFARILTIVSSQYILKKVFKNLIYGLLQIKSHLSILVLSLLADFSLLLVQIRQNFGKHIPKFVFKTKNIR
jgi:hypothetical protein